MHSPIKFKWFIFGLLAIAFTSNSSWAREPNHPLYRESKRIFFGGEGGWDYVLPDSETRRLYVARMNRIMVIDMDTEKLIGEVKGLDGAHGTALVKELNQGFSTSGKSGEVFVFDLKTLSVLEKIKVGENPDAIFFDSFSKTIYAFNGKSKSVSAIDAASHKVLTTLPLDGKPEFATGDGQGKVFVAIEDKNEIQVIDSKFKQLVAKFPTGPCEEPSALAIDLKQGQLILGCGNKLAAMINKDSGKIMQTFKVGDGVDAAAFDPIHRLAFISAGEGTLTILSANEKGFQLLQNVTTSPGARTLGVDQKTGKAFLPIAKFGQPLPGQKRTPVVPDSFSLIVVNE